jgi:hypothetical protein
VKKCNIRIAEFFRGCGRLEAGSEQRSSDLQKEGLFRVKEFLLSLSLVLENPLDATKEAVQAGNSEGIEHLVAAAIGF